VAASEPRFTRRRAPPLQRLLLKTPPLVYRGFLAEFMRSRCVMLLTTVGRRSGLSRTTAVSFMPHGAGVVVFSGWGVGSNWYRNVLANPSVRVTVGRRRFAGTARVVPEAEHRRALMLEMQQRSSGCGPPRLVRPFLAGLRLFDYDAEIRMAVAQGGDLPVLEITPV